MKKLLLYGAGGGSEELLKVLIEDINRESPSWEILGFVDDDPAKQGGQFCGYPVFGPDFSVPHGEIYCISGVIGNKLRGRIGEGWIKDRGFLQPTLIHPSVIKTKDFVCGPGAAVLPQVEISFDVVLGAGVIVNYGTVLGHNLRVGDYTFIGPSVTIPGGCRIGSSCLIGAGATFVHGVEIEDSVTIGAGTTVLGKIKAGSKVMDMPRKVYLK